MIFLSFILKLSAAEQAADSAADQVRIMKHPVVPGSQTPGQFLSWRCSSFLSSPGPTLPGTDNRSAQNPKQNPWKKNSGNPGRFRRILGKKKRETD